MSFAWPLRGQFGHWWGALIPGAAAAVCIALIHPDPCGRSLFAQAVILGSLGFALGGENIPYGKLILKVMDAPSMTDVTAELGIIFFIGASWGALGMTLLGLAAAEKRMPASAFGGFVWVGAATLAAVSFMDVDRFEGSAALFWLILAHGYNFFFLKSRLVRLFSAYGIFGFGLGFLTAVLLLFFGRRGQIPGTWWVLRDQIFGGIGGIFLGLAILHGIRRQLAPAVRSDLRIERPGFVFFTVFIPGVNACDAAVKWLANASGLDPFFSLIILTAYALPLVFFGVYFLKADPARFSDSASDRLLIRSSLYFFWYLSFLAISKSVLYSGWNSWEGAFSLFLAHAAILTFVLPQFAVK